METIQNVSPKEDLINVIKEDDVILNRLIIKLIKKEKYYLLKLISNSVNHLSTGIIIDIFKCYDLKAVEIFANHITDALDERILHKTDSTSTYITLAEKLVNILTEEKHKCIDAQINKSIKGMLEFLKEQYPIAVCTCGNDLLDPYGAGVCTKVYLPFSFDRAQKYFEEDIENYTLIDEKYKCGNCNKDVTHLIEDLI